MLQNFEGFNLTSVLNVWARAQINKIANPVNGGHFAIADFGRNELLLVFVFFKEIESLRFGALKAFKRVFRFDDLLYDGVKRRVVFFGDFEICAEIVKEALICWWAMRQKCIRVMLFNRVAEYMGRRVPEGVLVEFNRFNTCIIVPDVS